MKTLSVRQPWANLIVHGIKNVENRTWRTHFRGRVLVHAPAGRDRDFEYLTEKHGILPGYKSAIIGSVEIIDCIQDSTSPWAEPGVWHWVLREPVLFEEPILGIKGKLGLWEYDI